MQKHQVLDISLACWNVRHIDLCLLWMTHHRWALPSHCQLHRIWDPLGSVPRALGRNSVGPFYASLQSGQSSMIDLMPFHLKLCLLSIWWLIHLLHHIWWYLWAIEGLRSLFSSLSSSCPRVPKPTSDLRCLRQGLHLQAGHCPR